MRERSRTGSTATPTCWRAARCWCARPTRSRSSASRAAICRDRAGRTISRPARCAASRCRRACASRTGCPTPIFTPATKATAATTSTSAKPRPADSSARTLIRRLRELTLALYEHGARARRVARHHPGRHQVRVRPHADSGEIILIDEVMTPDSSRYWPRDQYTPGGAQPSFDKQFVRDYLEEIRWNKQPPVPSLPDDGGPADPRQVSRGVSPHHRSRLP